MQDVHAIPLALQTLLSRAIDYAGLFPPASLSLEEAIANYAKYRRQPESWMLGRFICPAPRLPDLVDQLDMYSPASPWQISSLGTGGNKQESFLRALTDDLHTIHEITSLRHQFLAVSSLEVRWPADSLDADPDEHRTFLDGVLKVFSASQGGVTELFFELPAHPSVSEYQSILQAIRLHNDARTPVSKPLFGAKVRCGGTEPSAFPSPAALAAFLAACTRAGVPFKATAGLHHPLYHFDADLGVFMHGFLNVFFASILMSEGELDEQSGAELLVDGNASHFDITANKLSWNGHSVPAPGIARARRASITSFGSCSFDEPRDDLQELGLL